MGTFNMFSCRNTEKKPGYSSYIFFVYKLEFYGLVNTVKVMSIKSANILSYSTLMDMLTPLSSSPVRVHILSSVTDYLNQGKRRMTVEMIS